MADKKNILKEMTPKEKEEMVQNNIKTLRASYEMYEKTKLETIERRKNAKDKNGNKIYSENSLDKTLELIQTMQDDVKSKYLELGGDEAELYIAPKKGKKKLLNANRDRLMELMRKEMEREIQEQEAIAPLSANTEVSNEEAEYITYAKENNDIDIISLVDKDVKPTIAPKPKKEIKKIEKVTSDNNNETKSSETFRLGDINSDISKAIGKNIKYDVIPIPSGGKPYKHKIGKIPVAYLTAFDENMIMSPNLYQDGSFLNHIIKSKIMTSKIDTDELLPGDREAILLWLRASGYGPIYPITATDKETGKSFRTEFDLTKLKYKKFDLDADENGWFTYVLPSSKDEIKFKFLSYKEIEDLSELTVREDASMRKLKFLEVAESIEYYTEEDTNIDNSMKEKIKDCVKTLREYSDNIKEDLDSSYNHLVTNRMIKNIMSVNGVTDRKYIEEYVSFLNLRDATSLRKYIIDNEPGLDMNIEVEKPESLGGGSATLFLTLDQYIFLNVKN